jgi:cytochrome P450
MTLVDDLDLPMVSMFDVESPEALHAVVHELQLAGRWIVRTPLGVSVIEHDAIRELQKDPRLHTLGARLFEMQGITEGSAFEGFQKSILNLEGAEHTRLRRLVSRAFTPRAADRMRPMMRAWVDQRARAMAERGGGDVVTDLAEAYPIAVICELVGAPEEDWPRFSAWANDVFRVFNLGNLAEDLPVIEAATESMRDYVSGLIDERRAAGADRPDDLLSELMGIEEEGDRLSYEELRGLVMSVLLAGTDTTRNQLGLTVLALARHPDQWDRLVADPGLIPRAVEEALRWDPTAAGTPRFTVEDVTFRDVTIPAGTFVSLSSASGNRDPGLVQCPMDFDIGADRGSWSVLTFGSGPHYCLGAALARAELQEALTSLVRHWRRVELDGEPALKPYIGLYGPTRLNVRIEAAEAG